MPAALIGEVESPRPLRVPGGRLRVVGWCVARGIATAPAVRLSAAAITLAAHGNRARPDVAALLPAEPAAGTSGFSLEGDLPAGVHLGRFEARLPDGNWEVFRELTLAVEPASFTAALDTPISAGTLRDRVKVGGWALDPHSPVKELSLRYGHRDIACVIDQPRTDVPAIFPQVSHAKSAGFTSEDFLVAGHGPVRIRARLADGRIAIASTDVTFSVDRDENHAPELNLTAGRIGLDELRAERALPPATRCARPLNILFILPGSFAANHALHVAALANELAAAGHTCAVAVPRDVDTLAHLDRPAFRGLTYAEAESGTAFSGRGPDVVHAWTTRENVRQLAESLRARHGARVLVHLEDNEQQILALSLGRSSEELARLGDDELARLLPPDLSHPRRAREFLARADGVTVIMDRLREFVPADKPCLTLMPAADARHFYPRPLPTAFRTALQLPAGTTVLFYHGNVHASNAAEVRALYAAVLDLNRTGTPVTLIRTGLDRVDFLGDVAGAVAPHVISLGLVPHHHHLPPLMALADIFVQPGEADAFNDYRFPSKLPEFFALGRPVVLPRTNLGHQLRHGTDAWVLDRADAAGIAGAVRTLRQDPGLSARLAAGAAAYAAAHFSWRRSAETLASFYGSLARS